MSQTGGCRPDHLEWLLELTQLPTAAGREWRVTAWIDRWASQRPDVRIDRDGAGNLVLTSERIASRARDGGSPIFITAHLDHPGFVVERVLGGGLCEVSFRGGVQPAFFEGAPITLYPDAAPGPAGGVPARITGPASGPHTAFSFHTIQVEPAGAADLIGPGDVGTWRLEPSGLVDGIVHAPGCDDLAGVAAALAAWDMLRGDGAASGPASAPVEETRLLFTRAEEIGFVGAIAACRARTMPPEARVIALENSRAFPESPIGAGPIVRVGDRISIFSPWLTAACAKRAEEVFGRPAQPHAAQTGPSAGRPWQRKLMPGGACEASVFCSFGYAATCLCLPLGNYHNMPHLAEHLAGTYDAARLGPARAEREFIALADFAGLVDLLVGIGTELPAEDPNLRRFEKLFAERAFVL
ncbi:MAG TPA: hypothetical protein VD963_07130 [Phycisphaerales bacterium]|nr:hypothetical protein [Phycisphaerales bacterium]